MLSNVVYSHSVTRERGFSMTLSKLCLVEENLEREGWNTTNHQIVTGSLRIVVQIINNVFHYLDLVAVSLKRLSNEYCESWGRYLVAVLHSLSKELHAVLCISETSWWHKATIDAT